MIVREKEGVDGSINLLYIKGEVQIRYIDPHGKRADANTTESEIIFTTQANFTCDSEMIGRNITKKEVRAITRIDNCTFVVATDKLALMVKVIEKGLTKYCRSTYG